MKIRIFIMFILSFSGVFAAAEEEPPKIGNFSLPPSQQVSVFWSFGDFLIDQGQFQVFLFADDFLGKESSYVDIFPYFVYGFTDNLSLLGTVPIANYRQGNYRSSGLEDIFFQLEYAFYNGSSKTYLDQATVVVNVSFPSGSLDKDPETGAGVPGYFLGLTFNRTAIEWFAFMNYGAQLYPSTKPERIGNTFLYQYGYGRLIATWKGWIFSWLLELDGNYTTKNHFHGILDPNSGGHYILLTPSLWLSSEKVIIQFGVAFPVYEHLNGHQEELRSILAMNVGWLF